MNDERIAKAREKGQKDMLADYVFESAGNYRSHRGRMTSERYTYKNAEIIHYTNDSGPTYAVWDGSELVGTTRRMDLAIVRFIQAVQGVRA
ncbi:MAG: hypothetical protein M3P06_11615 [Acidobacteriota bacterium]|nr:hypothetical protein [Acidobacteriota bacterium]